MRDLCCLLVLLLGARAALADGGTLRLHQDAGPFTITLFSAPQPLQTGEADLSVMVQDRASGQVLLDPVVDLAFAMDTAAARPETVRLTHRQASNQLLQAATINFRRPGQWRLTLSIHRGHDAASLSTECMVDSNSARTALVWFYTLLPAALILLFAVHQRLKLRRARHTDLI